MRASQCPMTRLPTKAREALVVLALGLVVSHMVAGQAKCFIRFEVLSREEVEFLEELEHSQLVASI